MIEPAPQNRAYQTRMWTSDWVKMVKYRRNDTFCNPSQKPREEAVFLPKSVRAAQRGTRSSRTHIFEDAATHTRAPQEGPNAQSHEDPKIGIGHVCAAT